MKPWASCSLRRANQLVAEQHRASTTRTTVIRSLGRLRKDGLVTTDAPPERDRSTVYRLHPESIKDDTIKSCLLGGTIEQRMVSTSPLLPPHLMPF